MRPVVFRPARMSSSVVFPVRPRINDGRKRGRRVRSLSLGWEGGRDGWVESKLLHDLTAAGRAHERRLESGLQEAADSLDQLDVLFLVLLVLDGVRQVPEFRIYLK